MNQHATIRVPSLKGETREGHAWARKMCRWLKSKPHGAFRVLHSAAALRSRHGLHGSKKRFQKAYDYLAHRLRYLNYRRHRQCHLPIGSGVTEAARTRAVGDEGVWTQVHPSYLQSKMLPEMRTQQGSGRRKPRKAA